MSEIVHYTGKLKLIKKLPNESLEEQCKRILSYHNYFELDNYCDSWKEMLCEELYTLYTIIDTNIYKIMSKETSNNTKFFANKNKDGIINYNIMYHNGDYESFSDAIINILKSN